MKSRKSIIPGDLVEKICECGNKFRYNPKYSSIHPDKCNFCQNKQKFTKQREKLKLAAKSKEPAQNKWNGIKKYNYVTSNSNGKKRLKTPKERFYSHAAWNIFSRYIKLLYSIDGEMVKCCTCNTYHKITDKELHTGHWIKVFDGNSTNYSVSLVVINVGPQCYNCNVNKNGNQERMKEFLIDEFGEEEINNLVILSKQPLKMDEVYLQSMCDKYSGMFDQLLLIKNINDPWKHK